MVAVNAGGRRGRRAPRPLGGIVGDDCCIPENASAGTGGCENTSTSAIVNQSNAVTA